MVLCYSSKISTLDLDRLTDSMLKMLSIFMKMKNLLILYTIPVLSISANFFVPGLGLGFLICTRAPILKSPLALSPFCVALARAADAGLVRFRFGGSVGGAALVSKGVAFRR